MNITWLTDIHLNFINLDQFDKFCADIKASKGEIVVISGDISDARMVEDHLTSMANKTGKTIYFVAGNHDYYHGDVESVRNQLSHIPGAIYLTSNEPQIYKDIAIVGVDGWADGQYGDYMNSPIVLNDSVYIQDLHDAVAPGRRTINGYCEMDKKRLLTKMQELAFKDATILIEQLEMVIESIIETILVVTHIPPFSANSLYQGKIANDDYLPFYTCKAIGGILMNYAATNPDKEFIVLCGHSHHEAIYQPLPNLLVQTGASEYYKPSINVIEID